MELLCMLNFYLLCSFRHRALTRKNESSQLRQVECGESVLMDGPQGLDCPLHSLLAEQSDGLS